VVGLESVFHDSDGGGALIDHDEAALVFCGGFGGGAAAREEVENRVTGVRVDADDPFEDA